MIPIHSFLFSKNCFDKWGAFDSQFKTHEDWDLHLNFSLKGANYLYHNYCGAYYCIHPNSSSRTDLTGNRKDTINVLLKFFSMKNCTFFQKLLIRRRYGEFVADFLVESIKYKRIKFWETLNFREAGTLSAIAVLLLPVFLITKSVKRLLA